uniref:Apolipoprotein B receptor n=1 Tax=Phocoena sinus TaxID=42100 RepID=A0A8C9E225_PHOSS
MDFLRLHLPGLHQALRGALESFSTFVSYLMGDDVPTAERREACAAEELREVAARSLGGKVEEEAQEAVEGLEGSQSKEDGGLRGPGEAGRCQEESSATEQTWGGGQGSSHGSQADRQDTGAWEAATDTRCQHSSIPLEPRRKSEAGSEAGRDRSSQAQESQQPDEQEVKREETLRTWEREEEEEEVRATEPGVAGGAESEGTWHKELERTASVDGQKVAEGRKESEQGVDETAAEEIQGPGAKGAGREEEVVVVRGGRSTRAQGTQEPGAESEDRETSGREQADLPGVGETEHGAIPGERIPEGTGRVWALEETSKGGQEEEEVDENREAEVSLFPKQTQSEAEGGEGFEGQADQAEGEAVERQDSEIRAAQTSLKEGVQAEDAEQQQKSCWAAVAELLQDKAANEAEGDVDLEATPEARPKKEFSGERGEEEAQARGEALEVGWGGLEHRVTEGQEPELVGADAEEGKEEATGGQAPAEEAFGRDWDSEGREEAGRGEDLVVAAEGEKTGGQEFGLEGSAEEEAPGRGGQAEASEATREGEPGGQQAEVEESAVAEGSWGMDGVTSGSQVVRVEGLPGGHTLWEEEAGGWQATEQGQSSEGQHGDKHPEEEAQRPLVVEDIEVTGDQKAEAEEIDPEGLEDVQGQEDQSTNQDPAEAEPGQCRDAHSSWSEALLPGALLDVSVPRSRALLSRSSSQRRSRPSFRRHPAPEQPQEPPSPPPEEELVAPEQRLLEPEHAPEPSSSSPEGTPLPSRGPLGQRFGLAHPGMMQELRARLGQPKPQ